MSAPVPLLAAVGMVERLALRVLVVTAPWSSRSQHTAWLDGQTDGLREGFRRGYVAGLAANARAESGAPDA